jgi:hypothetical protein
MVRRLLGLGLLALSAAPLNAQTLFSTRGLGAPVEALDPRSRGLGSIGTGLPGLNTSLVNPADLAGTVRRGVSATLQPYYASEELGGDEDNLSGTRFPVITLLYPFRQKLVFGLGWGGLFDQTWAVVSEGQEVIGGTTAATSDRIVSRGGLSQVRLSASYELRASFAIGIDAGVYTGGVQRELTRAFPDSLNFRPFSVRNDWEYRGAFGGVGVRFDPSANTRLAASATFSGDLRAKPRTNLIEEEIFAMPLRFAFGASQVVASRLLATASAQYTGWSTSENFAVPGTQASAPIVARATWDVGGGLEFEELRTATRVFPLRVGFRYSQLPFRPLTAGGIEADPANEMVGSLGLGLRLAADDFGPLAVADVAVERGRRSGWGVNASSDTKLTENFWRISASISLFGR